VVEVEVDMTTEVAVRLDQEVQAAVVQEQLLEQLTLEVVAVVVTLVEPLVEQLEVQELLLLDINFNS
tara:strand:+ start:632 stop:832 length:201 start_codon:yes stop_codon:yes gene_type:complete